MTNSDADSKWNIEAKSLVRTLLRQRRAALGEERKRAAAAALFLQLLPLLENGGAVLSFASLPEEIDTAQINAYLEQSGKLLLPKVEGEKLQIYRVSNSALQLCQGSMRIQEPDPTATEIASLEEVSCILVPGLGFHPSGSRIGYGKGHYDRLISELRQKALLPITIGIGFSEQLLDEPLPLEPHDQLLDRLLLA
ncbi:MAG: 5-formyltetrahydrofolate cyclo-ligase [Chlamydiota bacterium]